MGPSICLAPRSTKSMEHLKGCYENSNFMELVKTTHQCHPLHTYWLDFFLYVSRVHLPPVSARLAGTPTPFPRVGALTNGFVGGQLHHIAAPWSSTCSGAMFSELEPCQTGLLVRILSLLIRFHVK